MSSRTVSGVTPNNQFHRSLNGGAALAVEAR